MEHFDLIFTDILRVFINWWLIGNFLYFGCLQKGVKYEEFEGLDEIELDIVRKSQIKNKGT